MSSSPSPQPWPLPLFLLLVLAGAAAIAAGQSEQQPITHPGCPDKCGNISIPFPFGLMPGCFRDGFVVTCDHSFDPPRAFLADADTNRITVTDHVVPAVPDGSFLVYDSNISYLPIELMDVSINSSEARVYCPITSSCSINTTHLMVEDQDMALGGRLATQGPFAVSEAVNVVVGVGWQAGVTDGSSYASSTIACRSELPGGHLESARNGSCAGRGCCEAALRQEEYQYGPITEVSPGIMPEENSLWRTSPCSYAMVVQKSWYNFSTPDLYGDRTLPGRFPRGVPVVLDFAIVGDAACPAKGRARRKASVRRRTMRASATTATVSTQPSASRAIRSAMCANAPSTTRATLTSSMDAKTSTGASFPICITARAMAFARTDWEAMIVHASPEQKAMGN